MAGYAIAPLNAPLPTAWNLPFQPDAGIHTSILISESGVGFSVAPTRQNAGSARKPSAALPGPGGVNVPASTACANAIVAFGSASIDRVPHEALAWRVRSGTSVASRSAHKLAV